MKANLEQQLPPTFLDYSLFITEFDLGNPEEIWFMTKAKWLVSGKFHSRKLGEKKDELNNNDAINTLVRVIVHGFETSIDDYDTV